MNKHKNDIVSLLPKIILRELYANKIKKKLKILKQTDMDILNRFNLTGGSIEKSIKTQLSEIDTLATTVLEYNNTVSDKMKIAFDTIIKSILEKHKNELQEKQNELQEKQKELNTAQTELQQIKTNLQDTTNKLSALIGTADQNIQLQTQHQSYLKQIEELQSQITQKETENIKINTEIETLKKQLKNSNDNAIRQETINTIKKALETTGPNGIVISAAKDIMKQLITSSLLTKEEGSKIISELFDTNPPVSAP